MIRGFSRVQAPAKKMSEISDSADAAGVVKSKIQRVKPASKVASSKVASSCAEEPERGILPWVGSWYSSMCH
jgi:hypothetical protein